eukprot:m51a1_g10590 putative geranylgeranyl pyrophosphate (643) ;mRNA; f:5472-17521
MAFAAFRAKCDELLPVVESELRQTLAGIETRVSDEMSHAFLTRLYTVLRSFTSATGGKRLRPLSCILAYRLCGGKPEGESRARRAAVALELLHNTTLVHDDIMDEDQTRRGAPTVWKVLLDDRLRDHPAESAEGHNSLIWSSRAGGFAVSHAILAGNVLFGEALRLCSDMPEISAILADAYLCVHHGQVLDMVPRKGAGEQDYIEMCNRKTGWLFRASVLAGATLAGASAEQRQALERFALDSALAFQVQDDIMDIDPTSRKGHARGSDIRQGKATLLALGAIASGAPGAEELARIVAAGGTEDEAAVERAIKLIEQTSLEAVHTRAVGLADKAKSYLRALQWADQSALAFFESMADFFVQRNKTFAKFEPYWLDQQKRPKPSLFRALFGFGLQLVLPLVLPHFVEFLMDRSIPVGTGVAYLLGVCAAALLISFTNNQQVLIANEIGLRARHCLQALVYRKALRKAATALGDQGRCINLISADAHVFVETLPSINNGLVAPFLLAAIAGMLYQAMGWPGLFYGENFSTGQRQLICMARAILRNARILILDEATASVDMHTDILIQKMLRSCFAECTVFTIAHRLHTIMDSSRVMVISEGALAEFDTPTVLLAREGSLFAAMVHATMDEETLGRLVAGDRGLQ